MDALPPVLSYLLRNLPSPSEVIESFRRVPPLAAFSGGILLWLALVRASRWRRYNSIHREYGLKWDNGKGIITPEEAQKIIAVPIMYDMPGLLAYATTFALFKTYGIVRITFDIAKFQCQPRLSAIDFKTASVYKRAQGERNDFKTVR